MRAEWVRTVDPATEPITLAEAKLQARITSTAEDSLLTSYLAVARQAAEDYLNRGLITQTWKLTLSQFAERIWLPMAAPLQSVTSVKYYDAAGVQQTLSTSFYEVDTITRPGSIVRAPSQTWPTVQSDKLANRIEIIYVVGFTSAGAVPERFKQGLRMYVTYLDADRDGFADEARAARKAAEDCWSDRIEWQPPACMDEEWAP